MGQSYVIVTASYQEFMVNNHPSPSLMERLRVCSWRTRAGYCKPCKFMATILGFTI